ncbi:AAA family ATPase [Corynebacterium kutscheri]|uniref:AAA domain n=1 Tax=Corynebacterium kutscheri TaxID=35755 RepID=A0A0F6R2L8_9CORY|nr:AAA family ATPase [Corynebacterium kutscheri]AKE41738.1 AAA domain [Corynebacterium kutscheri]VEH10065.1 Cytidylate kinase [Corynebacterium kutscheri]
MIVLIDGASGSGKSTLAKQLARYLQWPIIHLDDFYPGWSGLRAGSEILAHSVLAEKNPGYYQWDWEKDYRGRWIDTDYEDVIIEGVGCLTEESLLAARRKGTVLSVVLRLSVEKRKQRALQRDPSYAPFWHMWAAQEEKHWSVMPIPDFCIEVETGTITRYDERNFDCRSSF